MGKLTNLLGWVQAAEAARITGGALSRPYVWPIEEQLALEYYEPAARRLCWLSNEDPEARCEFMGDASAIEQAAKVIFWVPKWQTLVARLREFDLHWLALGATVEERAAILQRRVGGATNSAEPEQAADSAPAPLAH